MENKKQLKSELEELNKKIQPIKDKIEEIESEESIEWCKKKIGECFVFENSCSGKEKWNLYYKVIGIPERDSVEVISCQKTEYGTIEIKKETRCMFRDDFSCLGEPVEAEIFESNFNKLTQELISV